MAVQITDISAILKKVFAGNKVQSLVQKMTPLLDEVKSNVGVEVMNNNLYISSRTGRHSGVYFVSEGTEPQTGKSKYQLPVAPIKYEFGTVEFSDQALETAKNDKQSVENLLQMEVGAAMEAAAKEANRVMHGAGTGKICLANGAGISSVTVTVDNCPSEPASGGNHTKYIYEGGYVKIGTNDNCLVSSVDSTTQFTISAAKSWSDNDVIYRAGSDEPMGLAGIIDDGDNVATIQGIVRATYNIFNSNTDDTPAELAETDMIRQLLQARKYSGKGQEHVIFMNTTMFLKYGSLLTSMKRSTDPKPVLSGGWRGLEFMDGVPVILDDDCWEGYVQGMNKNGVTIGQASDAMKWLEADSHGGILMRSNSNRTVWEGTFKWYFNFVGLNFKSQFRLSQKTS